MTDSHHGGFLSMMIMVGICQGQNPTIDDEEAKNQKWSVFSLLTPRKKSVMVGICWVTKTRPEQKA